MLPTLGRALAARAAMVGATAIHQLTHPRTMRMGAAAAAATDEVEGATSPSPASRFARTGPVTIQKITFNEASP